MIEYFTFAIELSREDYVFTIWEDDGHDSMRSPEALGMVYLSAHGCAVDAPPWPQIVDFAIYGPKVDWDVYFND